MVRVLNRVQDGLDFLFESSCPGNGIFGFSLSAVIASALAKRDDLILCVAAAYLSVLLITLVGTLVIRALLWYVDAESPKTK